MTYKFKLFALTLSLIVMSSCQTKNEKTTPMATAGTFKIAILYPNGEGATFNMDYYETQHMPMVAGFLGDNLIGYEIEKGIGGRTPNDPVPFLAIGYFYVQDLAAYDQAIGEHIDTIVGDFKNYTNIQPTIQKSEIQQVIPTKK
ncbi:MAG TPA: EthD family reductase [Flavobacteriaceae bacterium]|nr:EthD family reductase [Flavobacteriaceae bacterium]HRW43525.1 EthD family reductase [Flavobacteriaceae bacterium]